MNQMPIFSNIPPHMLQVDFFKNFSYERFEQIKNISHFHKLTWKYPPEKLTPENIKGTFAEYVLTKNLF